MEDISHFLKQIDSGSPVFEPDHSYKPKRFDLGFDASVHPEADKMHKAAQWFVNDIVSRKNEPYWLVLCGPSGIGKTHLAKAIDDQVTRNTKFLTTFASWNIVTSRLRDGDYSAKQVLRKEPFLILDDIGTENNSEFIRSALYEILNGRLGKWTVITSNLSPENIAEQIDARITSRLYRGLNQVVVAKDCPDYCFTLKTKH